MASEEKVISYAAVYEYALNGLHGGGLEDEDFNAIINALDSVPAVAAVEIFDPELRRFLRMLFQEYERAKKYGWHMPLTTAIDRAHRRIFQSQIDRRLDLIMQPISAEKKGE